MILPTKTNGEKRLLKDRCPAQITPDELSELTTLSRQRIWQLEAEDKIPKSHGQGWFPFLETITRLFIFYRETKLGGYRERVDVRIRQEIADALLTENKVRIQMYELVKVEDLAVKMNKPLNAMRQVILASDLDNQDKDALLVSLRELYASIFEEPVRSNKLRKLKAVKL